jgi:hypothetical protein
MSVVYEACRIEGAGCPGALGRTGIRRLRHVRGRDHGMRSFLSTQELNVVRMNTTTTYMSPTRV